MIILLFNFLKFILEKGGAWSIVLIKKSLVIFIVDIV